MKLLVEIFLISAVLWSAGCSTSGSSGRFNRSCRRLFEPAVRSATPQERDEIFRCFRCNEKQKIMDMLDDGIDVNTSEKGTELTVLMKALECGWSIDEIRGLIEKGADINAQDQSGYTPLIHAIFRNRNADPAMIRYLISCGADVNVNQYEYMTPLMWVVNFSRHQPHAEEIIKILLDSGADINAHHSDNGYSITLKNGIF